MKNKYNLNWIKEQHNQNKKIKYLFFWGHRPNPDGSIGKSCLSQWWLSSFEKDQKEYKTAEHWMMYQKAVLFKDEEMAEKILVANTPGEAKKLGRKVKGFDHDTWEAHRDEIVVEGNVLKFSQHEEMKAFLLNTGERVLVEASPRDNIWGIGLSQDAEQIENPNTWKGLNLLGFALMEARDQLRTL